MPNIKQANAHEAKQLLNQNAVLIDVREPAEYYTRRINGANLHPLSSIGAESLSHYKNSTLLIYCQKGIRGNKACEKIIAEHPDANIVNLEGGIEAWQQAGFHTQTGGGKSISLDRQMQILSGAIVFILSLLGLLVDLQFIIGSAIIGISLLIAGITGFNPLTRLLTKAPWNKYR